MTAINTGVRIPVDQQHINQKLENWALPRLEIGIPDSDVQGS